MNILNSIHQPADIKQLNYVKMRQLAGEIRSFLLKITSTTGGHLSSNLGVVELTIALMKSFDFEQDKIVWDVGHQSYVYKILTGRKQKMDTIRQWQGISGFPKRNESEYDFFGTGHSSTSISAALGMAKARDILNQEHYVISVIGDGALTGGMAYEALNNGAEMQKNFIVILNDNSMSIEKNVGGMAVYLDSFRTGKIYRTVKQDLETVLGKVPIAGDGLVKHARTIKNSVKHLLVPGVFFEELGYKYLGPIDGHNLRQLDLSLEQAKTIDGPVLLHVKTIKGKGYHLAEQNPLKFHGVKPFDVSNGDFYPPPSQQAEADISYSKIVGDTLTEIAMIDKKVVAITAAMTGGTGLTGFSEIYKDRFFDVGIAEQHAVTFAAGLACCGLKPFFVVYSTFLQRAYDQIIHDVALQKLPVVFCIDRAGIVGEDGDTHQGLFDISYLSAIPNLTIMAPKSGKELKEMLIFAAGYQDGPIAIRYPKGIDNRLPLGQELEYGQAEWIQTQGNQILLISVGTFYPTVQKISQRLNQVGKENSFLNLRFIKPIDSKLLEQMGQYQRIYVFEENQVIGGVGALIKNQLAEIPNRNRFVKSFGINDQFVSNGSIAQLIVDLSLDVTSLWQRIKQIEEEWDETTA